MIGTNLPPGTELICIDAKPRHVQVPLTEGAVYTIKKYILTSSGYVAVILNEVQAPKLHAGYFGGEDGFLRERFRVLEIPKCLTDMLETKKIKAPKKELIDFKIIFFPDGSYDILCKSIKRTFKHE